MKRWRLAGAIAAALVAAAAARAATTAWTFTADSGVRIPAGVSTEVVQLGGTILAYVGTPTGAHAYRSADGLSFAPVDARLPGGSDPAIVPLPDGRLRMYYDVCNPCGGAGGGKEIRSAVSSDGLSWTTEPGVRLTIATSRAGGVPDAVVLPNGDVRLYFLPSLDNEVVDSATSSDGLTFVRDPGDRLTGGYVDPAVLRLADGSWLMVVSRTPREQQRLFVAHSADGLSWTLDPAPVLQPAGGANALDPTLLQLPDGRLRVYYSTAGAGEQLSGPYAVASGVLAQVALYRLTVVVAGRGTVSGGRIAACSRSCGASLPDGTTVKLTARPAKGYRLKAWSGACSGARPACSLALRADAAARATFVKRAGK